MRTANNKLPILQPQTMTRRELIFHAGAGFSGLALTALLDRDNLLAAEPQRKRATPWWPKRRCSRPKPNR